MRAALVTVLLCALACGGSDVPIPPPVSTAPDALQAAGEVHLANIRQLTRDSAENAEAYWSPRGDELVFQSSRAPYSCDQIYRISASGGEVTQVSSGKGRTTCPYFSSDGQRVIYASTHESGDACPPVPDHSQGYVWPIYDTYDIYSAKPDGSDLRKLTDSPGYDAEATVCPVDGSILFTSMRDGDLDLYRMDADGQNVKRLTDTPGYDGGAFFSADCSMIVWRASRPKGNALADYQRLLGQGLVRPSKLEIFVANADGTDARQVTYLDSASFAPYLHPGGRRILFSTNYPDPRGREFDIWSIGVDGTGLERITYAPGFDGFPMFSPDGTKLAFGSNRNQAQDGQTDVYVADWVEDARGETTETAADRVAADVAWLADDAREGRGPTTEGLKKAEAWLAEQFRAIGLSPATEGYLQAFEVPVSVTQGPSVSLRVDGGAVAADEFVAASISSSSSASGAVVDVGYGIVDEDLGWNDYKGKNVKGKVALIQRFVPKDPRFEAREVEQRASHLHHKAFVARERGAVAVIFHDRAKSDGGEEARLPALGLTRQGNVGIPVVFARWSAVEKAARARSAKARTVQLDVALDVQRRKVHNVIGVIPGSKPGSGAIVIGAHFDHLGRGHDFPDDSSREPGSNAIHNGADDNASGTAALLEIARRLSESGLERDVYVVAFNGEELGLLGAKHFVANPPKGLDLKSVVAMLNLDMVGRMRQNRLSVLGGGTATEWTRLVGDACAAARVECETSGSGYGPSDQMAFYGEGIPVLHFFTGAHSDYHTSTDDADRINAVGAARVAGIVAAVATQIGPDTVRLSYQKVAAPLPSGDAPSWGASLGTIPEYAEDGQPGMLLAGVRPGGPAEKAGLKKGDRLMALGGRKIVTVRDLVYVLRDAKPEQRVDAEILRDGARMTVKVTYGEATRAPRGD